jgi:hypothetical protein
MVVTRGNQVSRSSCGVVRLGDELGLISLLFNILFLLGTAAALVFRRARLRLGVDRHMLAVAGTVWLSSVLQTLFEHGDNARFLVPAQMLVIYVVARMAYAWWIRSRGSEAVAL